MKIETLVKVFEERGENPGPYYDKSLVATKFLTFQGIQLHKGERKDDTPICPNASYETLKISVDKRLLDIEDTDLPDCVEMFDPRQWPEDVGSRVTHGESEIRKTVADISPE
jgi:hypothetical protein